MTEQETNAPTEPAGMPSGTEEMLAWLVDRAQISDLLHRFARALDDRDWVAYADTYAEDGVLVLPVRGD
jgi:hypothetical protein